MRMPTKERVGGWPGRRTTDELESPPPQDAGVVTPCLNSAQAPGDVMRATHSATDPLGPPAMRPQGRSRRGLRVWRGPAAACRSQSRACANVPQKRAPIPRQQPLVIHLEDLPAFEVHHIANGSEPELTGSFTHLKSVRPGRSWLYAGDTDSLVGDLMEVDEARRRARLLAPSARESANVVCPQPSRLRDPSPRS